MKTILDKRVKKALADYEEMCETGKLHSLTVSDVDTIWFILKDLYKEGISETITEKVAKWFKKHKFSVIEEGIGWKIILSMNRIIELDFTGIK